MSGGCILENKSLENKIVLRLGDIYRWGRYEIILGTTHQVGRPYVIKADGIIIPCIGSYLITDESAGGAYWWA